MSKVHFPSSASAPPQNFVLEKLLLFLQFVEKRSSYHFNQQQRKSSRKVYFSLRLGLFNEGSVTVKNVGIKVFVYGKNN